MKLLRIVAALALGVAVWSGGSFASRATSGKPVVVIVMENREYSQIIGNPAATYLNELTATARLFTNYTAVTHHSLRDYLAMTAGSPLCPDDNCARPFTSATNIFSQLNAKGTNWRVYAESMPSACYKWDSGRYSVHHNPAPYYRNLVSSCAAHDVALPTTLPSTLAPLSFVIPNQCSNMHDCSVATGDGWLATWVPRFLAKGAIVVVTFDE